jgi:hypothetical protein
LTTDPTTKCLLDALELAPDAGALLAAADEDDEPPDDELPQAASATIAARVPAIAAALRAAGNAVIERMTLLYSWVVWCGTRCAARAAMAVAG